MCGSVGFTAVDYDTATNKAVVKALAARIAHPEPDDERLPADAAIALALAFCLGRFSGLTIVPLYLRCQMADIIKCVIGFILVKKGIWIQNFVAEEA